MSTHTATLSTMFRYPIKSCAGQSLTQVEVTALGLERDRHWVIVDDSGRFQTQRQIPHLVWIQTALSEQSLTLSAPSQPNLTIPLATEHSTSSRITIWNDRVSAFDLGDEVVQWLDNYLQIPGRHFRLVQFNPEHPRLCDTIWLGADFNPQFQPRYHPFTDAYSVNILSQASVDHLNERLQENGLETIGIERFRPNLVLSDVPAHAEDQMKHLTFTRGDETLVLEVIRPCTRCQIPEIDPWTAMREPGITDVLSEYRRAASMGEAICFGMQAVVHSGAPFLLQTGEFNYSLR
ncbi:MOSC domain-containing protein [Orrella sp. 11846]|uniref:MOSC domain-containing protein n=1 Tax=Orrella sp. 11846 TaxID=3409913 RepID=UPI003B5900BC